jgi:hypothetical protein
MNRKNFRLIAVAAVVLAINVATFPSAEARTLAGSHATANHTTDFWSASISWLTGLLPGSHAGLHPAANATTTTGGGTPTGGHSHPNTGSCIDPMGVSHCSPTN